VDRTNLKYLSGFNIHDNIAQASWTVAVGNGSVVGAGGGVGGNGGLANTYPISSCKAYYPTEAPRGLVFSQHFTFTVSPPLTNYFVTVNGKYRAVNGGFTNSQFTLSSASSDGDQITVAT